VIAPSYPKAGCDGEESPNSKGRVLRENGGAPKIRSDGKCHRKNTVLHQRDKGEKARQELTGSAAMQNARQTPLGARPNR